MSTSTTIFPSLRSKPPIGQLRQPAKAYYLDSKTPCPDPADYQEPQGLVNYIRHRLTDYPELRQQMRKEGAKESDITSLKIRTLTLVADAYPELKAECIRQQEIAEGREHNHSVWRARYFRQAEIPAVPAQLPQPSSGHEPTDQNGVDLIAPTNQDGEWIAALEEENRKLSQENERLRNVSLGSLFDHVADNSDEVKRLRERVAELERTLADVRNIANAVFGNNANVYVPPQPHSERAGTRKRTKLEAAILETLIQAGGALYSAELKLRVERMMRRSYPHSPRRLIRSLLKAGRVRQLGTARWTRYELVQSTIDQIEREVAA